LFGLHLSDGAPDITDRNIAFARPAQGLELLSRKVFLVQK
jgi:hypothetical protein